MFYKYLWPIKRKEKDMSWSKFSPDGSLQIASKFDGEWYHNLVAPVDEPDPRNNHIHFKYRTDANDGTAELVNCSLKVEGQHKVSRFKLIMGINRLTGLNIPFT